MVATIRYWDVFPRRIRGMRTPNHGQHTTIPLALCGDPQGVVFESGDPMTASVSDAGVVTLGMKVGHTTIRVYEPMTPENVREVAVEVLPCPGTDIQSVGVANLPGEDTGRYAPEGHVHKGLMQFGTDVQPGGEANSPGTREEAAHVDHVHEVVWLEYHGE